jgi:hypothetical protein
MRHPVDPRGRALEALGWDVRVLEGLDHTTAMLSEHVVPVVRPWLPDRLRDVPRG